MTKFLLIVGALALTTGSAVAACPAQTPGETAAEIKINELRIACLQQELAAETKQRSLELEIDRLGQSLRSLELQQRFQALPAPVIVTPAPMQF